ncbi:hypothetical protein D6Z50_08960 [Shigella flexneri]|nr:hypothetical protein [Shigella flexneri]MMW94161.1 hypothetical protein [Shigella flexneri]HBK2821395.1 HAD hydrolase family protein [Shigella flexneri]
MSVKVIVTDMDGTFLNDAKTYNQPRFMAQYQELKKRGIKFVVASGNDAEMLKMARYSFAMGNAAENIKQIARYATDDNNHEGALNVIQAVLDNTSPFNS